MKTTNSLKRESTFLRRPNILTFLKAAIILMVIAGSQAPLQAQETQYTKPLWWFGVAAGANLNFYNGSTQELNADLTVPTVFHEGMGLGLFAAPMIEIYRPGTLFGFMLQAGYDSRKGTFDEMSTPCNCPADLSAKITYITVEPSLKFAPFKSGFYLFGGPRFAFNQSKSFTYSLGINPDYPTQEVRPDVEGDFSNMNTSLVSAQIGAGWDIPLTSNMSRTQLVISPFVSFHPYFGQDPRSIETWNVTTIRAGAAIKIGRGRIIKDKTNNVSDDPIVTGPIEAEIVESDVKFSVYAPENIPEKRRVKEVFPIRNYIFFDIGSTEIPNRYVKLKKDQVKEFREDQVELNTPENYSGRSERQMIVYYNILNILGDRMLKNPTTTIKLVGSSEKGPADGQKMAESVKSYLVDVFSIAPERIATEGRDKPKLPSEHAGQTQDETIILEGDRRVSIESSSPLLLMEFQSGPDAPLRPIVVTVVEEAPIDSYVSLYADGSKEAYESWSAEITDNKGNVQKYGPYTVEYVTIPGKTIMGTNKEGTYNVKMIGKTKDGFVVQKDTTVHMVLWAPPVNAEVMRFSVLYGFDESKAITMYEKYITEVIVPKIPQNGTVAIHGHTDMIGDDVYNQKLSLERANDVKGIMQKALAASNRRDVKFVVLGMGEDLNAAPFDNKYPEERFYNRTVIIDLIP